MADSKEPADAALSTDQLFSALASGAKDDSKIRQALQRQVKQLTSHLTVAEGKVRDLTAENAAFQDLQEENHYLHAQLGELRQAQAVWQSQLMVFAQGAHSTASTDSTATSSHERRSEARQSAQASSEIRTPNRKRTRGSTGSSETFGRDTPDKIRPEYDQSTKRQETTVGHQASVRTSGTASYSGDMLTQEHDEMGPEGGELLIASTQKTTRTSNQLSDAESATQRITEESASSPGSNLAVSGLLNLRNEVRTDMTTGGPQLRSHLPDPAVAANPTIRQTQGSSRFGRQYRPALRGPGIVPIPAETDLGS